MSSIWTIFVAFAVVIRHEIVKGTTIRQKVAIANVNDSVWALNGDTVVLNCADSRTDSGGWAQAAANGTESGAQGSVKLSPNVGITLTLTMSQSLNGFSFKCRLRDFRDNLVFESGWIKLLLGDKINVTCLSGPSDCKTEGETLERRCSISGLPSPNATVAKLSGPPSELPMASSSGLAFKSLALDNIGVYRLIAKNILEETHVNITVKPGIDICVAPKINTLVVPDPIGCLSPVNFSSSVDGLPAPHVTWNTTQPSSERFTVSSRPVPDPSKVTEVVTSTLQIQRVQKEDDSVQFCVKADNNIAPMAKECFRINVTCNPPGPIANISVFNVTNTSVILDITAPILNKGNEVNLYYINFTAANMPKKFLSSNKAGLVTVTNLSPDTTYNISIEAVNKVGVGPAVYTNVTTRGKPESPEADVRTDKCTQISVSFKKTDSNDEPITKYYVLYKLDGSGENMTETSTSKETPVIITGLMEKKTYWIQIQVENEYGVSNLSMPTSVNTKKCGLSKKAIIGISVGVPVGVIAIIVVIVIVLIEDNDLPDGSVKMT